MRNPEIESAAKTILSFWETSDVDAHLDAGAIWHHEGDSGNSNEIVYAFLRSAASETVETEAT